MDDEVWISICIGGIILMMSLLSHGHLMSLLPH